MKAFVDYSMCYYDKSIEITLMQIVLNQLLKFTLQFLNYSKFARKSMYCYMYPKRRENIL